MKFTLSINMERTSPAVDMRDVARHTLEMAQIAEAGGFNIIWAAEHHAIELDDLPGAVPAPGPSRSPHIPRQAGHRPGGRPLLAPDQARRRGGDLRSPHGGRLEFGIGEAPISGIRPHGRRQSSEHGVPNEGEMLPASAGAFGRAITSTRASTGRSPRPLRCQSPLQKPHPPIWVAARDPGTYSGRGKGWL